MYHVNVEGLIFVPIILVGIFLTIFGILSKSNIRLRAPDCRSIYRISVPRASAACASGFFLLSSSLLYAFLRHLIYHAELATQQYIFAYIVTSLIVLSFFGSICWLGALFFVRYSFTASEFMVDSAFFGTKRFSWDDIEDAGKEFWTGLYFLQFERGRRVYFPYGKISHYELIKLLCSRLLKFGKLFPRVVYKPKGGEIFRNKYVLVIIFWTDENLHDKLTFSMIGKFDTVNSDVIVVNFRGGRILKSPSNSRTISPYNPGFRHEYSAIDAIVKAGPPPDFVAMWYVPSPAFTLSDPNPPEMLVDPTA